MKNSSKSRLAQNRMIHSSVAFCGFNSSKKLWWLLLLVFVLGGCKGSEETAHVDSETDSESACPWDTDDTIAAANTLTTDTEESGFVCPRGDEDWYRFAMPAGQDLLSVTMSLDAPVSPLDLMFNVWDNTATNVVATLDNTQSVVAGTTLTSTYFLAPGDYFLQVRDKGSDAQDVYHPYGLQIATAKDADTNEPNNNAAEATATDGTAITGYLSYSADEDWYAIQGTAQGIISVNITMPISDVALTFRIENAAGEELASGMNLAGGLTATALSHDLAVNAVETYYVIISSADSTSSDAAVGYSVSVSIHPDPDANESNNHPSEATALDPLACAVGWSAWTERTGFIASSGDVDWFQLNAAGCSRGVIEVDLTFANAGSLPAGFVASLGLVREVGDAPCTIDQECQLIPKTCSNNLGCAYFGNSCLNEGVCAGAGTCLPSGFCGANWAIVQGTETVPGVLHFTAPVQEWSVSGDIYLAVSDTLGEAYSTTHQYTLRARLITDKDTNEISGAYSTRPPSDDDDTSFHVANAVTISVHDCTFGATDTDAPVDTDVDTETAVDTETDTDTEDDIVDIGPPLIPGCCGDDDWIEGYLSYDYDQDWYAYAHPCPGEDCMIRIKYDIGAGPVDTYVQVLRGNTTWFDTITNITDSGNQSALVGAFGGTAASDQCFYAFNGHSGNPFWYHLSIRDTIFVSSEAPQAGTWDSSVDQRYRFCVEKVAAGCQTPCEYFEVGGCGSPQ